MLAVPGTMQFPPCLLGCTPKSPLSSGISAAHLNAEGTGYFIEIVVNEGSQAPAIYMVWMGSGGSISVSVMQMHGQLLVFSIFCRAEIALF